MHSSSKRKDQCRCTQRCPPFFCGTWFHDQHSKHDSRQQCLTDTNADKAPFVILQWMPQQVSKKLLVFKRCQITESYPLRGCEDLISSKPIVNFYESLQSVSFSPAACGFLQNIGTLSIFPGKTGTHHYKQKESEAEHASLKMQRF